VFVDPIKLRAAGLSATDVQRAIVGQNLTLPGGPIDTGPGALTFRVKGASPASRASRHHRPQRRQPPHPGRDVATVVDGEEEAETSANINGKQAVMLSIRKQSGENSVAVVDALRERLKELEPTLPAGTKFTVIRDNTETTRTSVNAVREHLLWARSWPRWWCSSSWATCAAPSSPRWPSPPRSSAPSWGCG
jgi:multidrug efflux pump subunit AcrB